MQLAWPEAALPWCAAGHGRSLLAAACLAVSRFLATAGLFDGTQLHCTPSNLTFVAVPKLKRNTSRRPPSALVISRIALQGCRSLRVSRQRPSADHGGYIITVSLGSYTITPTIPTTAHARDSTGSPCSAELGRFRLRASSPSACCLRVE